MTTTQLLEVTANILKYINEENITGLRLSRRSLDLFKDSIEMQGILISHAMTQKSYKSVLFLIDYYNIYQHELNFDKIENWELNSVQLSELNKLFRINKIQKIKDRT